MRNTLRVLAFFASLHLTILERPVRFEFFNSLPGHIPEVMAHRPARLIPSPEKSDVGASPHNNPPDFLDFSE
jgi:DNA-binding PucR family transcriptional regulator